MSAISHASLFTVRGRQVLAYLDHEEERDNLLVLRFRLWSDEIGGPVQITPHIGGDGKLSDETINLWEENIRRAFDELDQERVEKLLAEFGVTEMIENIGEAEQV